MKFMPDLHVSLITKLITKLAICFLDGSFTIEAAATSRFYSVEAVGEQRTQRVPLSLLELMELLSLPVESSKILPF